jgi:mono/diheme cytochrome c family protein
MRRIIWGGAAIVVAGAAVFWVLSAPKPAFSESSFAQVAGQGDAARGKIVFDAGGCVSCHLSPGSKDKTRLGGGKALRSPFGTFYAPNISQDTKDGIGAWRPVDLANALMSGVSPSGEHYYPALPYTTYAHMKPGDASDLMAYLKTLPAVSGKVRDHDLPLPFRFRRALGMWKFLFFDTKPIADDPARSKAWNRGHYLVAALSHCAECHSRRNMLGAIIEDTRYGGGPNPEGKGIVPNITPGSDGIKDWTESDIVEVLTSGFTKDGDSVGSTMAEVTANMAQLPAGDRAAIAAFIKSLPPRDGPPRKPAS